MNLEKAAKIAEIIGAISVVVSLIYVAFEINENTRSQKAATLQEIHRDMREILSVPISENELVIRYEQGEMLTEAERLRLIQKWSVMFRMYENIWFQAQNGTLDQELYEGYRQHIRQTLNVRSAVSIWDQATARGFFHSDFVRDVDEFLENNSSRGLYLPNE